MTTADQARPALPQRAAGCTDWQLDGEEVYRVVYTEDETIADCDVAVHLSAIQHPDGNLSGHDLVEIYLDTLAMVRCPLSNHVRWLEFCSTPPTKLNIGK